MRRILVALVLGCCLTAPNDLEANERKPNFIVIFCDDLGYADIGAFGAARQKTPALDRMAKEGIRLTDFYSTCSVCTPSRASLMTGCYPRRVNMHVDENSVCVLFPAARKGLHPDETTIAEMLGTQGYTSGCIGKWHLGDHPQFMPTAQGFESYFGIPYSNDMNRKQVPLPLVRGLDVVEAPVNQVTITERYTDEAVNFIRKNKDGPFFLYLAHAAVHLPLFPGKPFHGKSQNGRYGDWIEEVDWSTGQILKTLKDLKLDDNTLVLFTSDNGSRREEQGSNAPLRGRKGRTDEGGMRVPCVAWWPGKIPAEQTSSEITTTMDLLPTFAALTGAPMPRRKIDGHDMWSILSGKSGAKSGHEAFYYYQMDQLQAVRSGKWKLFVAMESKKKHWGDPEGATELELFDLDTDIHEDNNVAGTNPEVVEKLLTFAEYARSELGDGDQIGKGQREAGWVEHASPRLLSD